MARIARVVGTWLVTLLLAGMSILAGSIKFTQARSWDRAFAHWGYPTWFRPIVGVAEVAAGILVLAPPVAAYGAATMAVVMIGAAGTHLLHGEINRVPSPLVPLVLSLIVLWLRRSSWRRWNLIASLPSKPRQPEPSAR
jgi:uncharacterized membrane protein YphA (DoxX/SURF4 family)